MEFVAEGNHMGFADDFVPPQQGLSEIPTLDPGTIATTAEAIGTESTGMMLNTSPASLQVMADEPTIINLTTPTTDAAVEAYAEQQQEQQEQREQYLQQDQEHYIGQQQQEQQQYLEQQQDQNQEHYIEQQQQEQQQYLEQQQKDQHVYQDQNLQPLDQHQQHHGLNQDDPQQQQQLTQLTQESLGEDYTRVNGIGIWESWRKNFKSPLFALLDLFDNAIDACFDIKQLGENRVGEISVTLEDGKKKKGSKTTSISSGGNEMILRNNCSHPISPIRQILELYKSNKDTSTIGQNGIGTKQACANLCDLSFIITKNKEEISMGVIAKFLQTQTGPYLPSMTFLNDDPNNPEDDTPTIYQQLHIMDWGRIFTEYGKGIQNEDLRKAGLKGELNGMDDTDDLELKRLGLERIFEHIQSLLQDPNEYVFLCILTQIRHHNRQRILEELKYALPIYYVHVPPSFNVTINNQRVDFQYWEKRLIELTVFHVKIHPKKLWYMTSDWKNNTGSEDDSANGVDMNGNNIAINGSGYNTIRIFLGFDPYLNQNQESKNKEASLYIYSRRSGRLVKQVKNARGYLNLSSGSTTFCQGLTILVDDHKGCLPLTPTKQDLAFSLEESGEIHEANFETWISAFVHMYYNYHFLKFGDRKEALTDGINNVFNDLKQQVRKLSKKRNNDDDGMISPLSSLASLNDGKFTTLKNMNWRNLRDERVRVSNRKNLIRCKEVDTICHLKHVCEKTLQRERERKEEEKKRKLQEHYFQIYQEQREQELEQQRTRSAYPSSTSAVENDGSLNKRRRMVSHKSTGGGASPYGHSKSTNGFGDNEDTDSLSGLGTQDNDSPAASAGRRRAGLAAKHVRSSHYQEDDGDEEIDVEPVLSQAPTSNNDHNSEEVAALVKEKIELKKKYKKVKTMLKGLIEENGKLCDLNETYSKKIEELEKKGGVGTKPTPKIKIENTEPQKQDGYDEDVQELEQTIVALESKAGAQEEEIERLRSEKVELEKSNTKLAKEKDLLEQLEQESQDEIKLLRRKIDTLKRLSTS